MTPVDILTKARALIEKPENWTQGCSARDAENKTAHVLSKNAHCFCAIGSLRKVYGAYDRVISDVVGYSYLSQAAFDIDNCEVVELNDSTDHPTVLRMFDLAISKAKASEVRNG